MHFLKKISQQRKNLITALVYGLGMLTLTMVGMFAYSHNQVSAKTKNAVLGVSEREGETTQSAGFDGLLSLFNPLISPLADGQNPDKNPSASVFPSVAPSPQPTISPHPNTTLTPTATPRPTLRPTLRPSPRPMLRPTDPPEPSRNPFATEPPSELRGDERHFPVSEGELSFRVHADWGLADDRHLVWGNYPSQNEIRSLFMVAGSGEYLIFDVYNQEAQEIGECNVVLDDTTNGNYSIKIQWNFSNQPYFKKVYVDGDLKRTCTTALKPDDNGGRLFVGPVTDFSISP